MRSGIELKYIILFAILIALTGFTFEAQIDNAGFNNAEADQPSPAVSNQFQARR